MRKDGNHGAGYSRGSLRASGQPQGTGTGILLLALIALLSEATGDGQAFRVDDIPFPETQNYVKRILGTAEDYRRLYGPEGSAAATDAIPAVAHSPASAAAAPVKASAAAKKKAVPAKKKPAARKKKAA